MKKQISTWMKVVVLVGALSLATVSVAHEGHDHDGPVTVQAPKGGVIKGMEESYVEVVSKGKDLKIYIYSKDLKPQDVAGYQVTAKTQLPRGKKAEDLALQPKGNFFEASYDAKGSHRYTLILSVKDPKNTHPDQLNFTIEPRK